MVCRQWLDEILKFKGGNFCRFYGYVNLSNDDLLIFNLFVMDCYECDFCFFIDKKKNIDNWSKFFLVEIDLFLIVQIVLDLWCLYVYYIVYRDLKFFNILVVDLVLNKVEIVIVDFESLFNVVGMGFWWVLEVFCVLRGE